MGNSKSSRRKKMKATGSFATEEQQQRPPPPSSRPPKSAPPAPEDAPTSEDALYERLEGFYEEIDPVGVHTGDVKIGELVKWAVSQSISTSLTAINKELKARYGVTLDEFENGVRPSQNESSVPDIPDEQLEALPQDEEDVEAEYMAEMRRDLETFFRMYDPENMKGVDEMLKVFSDKGRSAMNVRLYDRYQHNLNDLDNPVPVLSPEQESILVKQGVKKKNSAEKFGLKIASDVVLAEMKGWRKLSATPQMAPRQRKTSAVSASLERKWKNRVDATSDAGSAAPPAERVNEVGDCPGFELDLSADTFGACKFCGQGRGAHTARRRGGSQVSASLERKWKNRPSQYKADEEEE